MSRLWARYALEHGSAMSIASHSIKRSAGSQTQLRFPGLFCPVHECRSSSLRLGGNGGPDGSDGVFVAKPIGNGRAGFVGEIPVDVWRTRSAAAGHLQKPIGVGLPHPIPGVLQPIRAVLFGLMSKPGDLVITPWLGCGDRALRRSPGLRRAAGGTRGRPASGRSRWAILRRSQRRRLRRGACPCI